jgi:RNA polymerase sigma factor (TIGR02999 family)
MSDVTRILTAIEHGDPQAAEQLLPLVYDELRKLAAARLAHENPGQTLQATALVHEAYLRLVGQNEGAPQQWNGRGHFVAAAAEAMRRILIENALHKRTAKAGGKMVQVEMSDGRLVATRPEIDAVAISDAVDRLAERDPRKATLVKLRYFAGFTLREAAEALEISESTADADWAYAKAWLRLQMED